MIDRLLDTEEEQEKVPTERDEDEVKGQTDNMSHHALNRNSNQMPSERQSNISKISSISEIDLKP